MPERSASRRAARRAARKRWRSGAAGAGQLAACVRALEARYAQGERYVAELAASTGLPLLSLPYRVEGIRGPDDLAALGAALLQGDADARAA